MKHLELLKRTLADLLYRPAVPVAICFALGALLARWWALTPGILLGATVAISCLAAAFGLKRLWRALLSAAGLLFFVLGLWAGGRALNPQLHYPRHVLDYVGKTAVVEGEVVSDARGWRRGEKVEVLVERITSGEVAVPVEGKVLLYLSGRATPRSGDRIEARVRIKPFLSYQNPGGFDYPLYMASKGVYACAFIPGKDGLINLERSGSSLDRARNALRQAFAEVLDGLGPGEETEVLRALILGERDGVPEELLNSFNRTGTRHLLAISGLHLGMAALLACAAAGFFIVRIPALSQRFPAAKAAMMAGLVLAGFYAWVTPLATPTARALIMLALGVVALIWDRLRDPFSVLALAGIIIIAFSPAALFTASFQLSFAAVAGIAFYFKKAGAKKRSRLADGAMVSFAATLATFPLVLFHFHMVAFVSPALNVVLVPLVGFAVVPLGLSALALSPLSAALARPAAHAAAWLIGRGLTLIKASAAVSWSSLLWPPPGIPGVCLIYLALFLIFAARGRRPRLAGVILLVPALLMPYALRGAASVSGGTLRVTALDAGYGASSVVRLPGGRILVVDAGPAPPGFDFGEKVVAPALRGMGVVEIDHLALTQAWPGLMGGIASLAREFDVREFWFHGPKHRLPLELLAVLKRKGTPLVRPHRIDEKGAVVEPILEGADSPAGFLASFEGASIMLAHGGLPGPLKEGARAIISATVEYTPRALLKRLMPEYVVYTFSEREARAKEAVRAAGLKFASALTVRNRGAITFEIQKRGWMETRFARESFWRPKERAEWKK